MTWGKVDDKFHSHPKPENAGLLAVGLWTMALSYCCDLLTDGHVSRARVARLAIGHDGAALAEQLVASGLWHGADDPCDSPECDALRRGGGGWRFHDWAKHQPLRSDVEAKQAAERERKAAGRSRQGRAANGRITSPEPGRSATPEDVRSTSARNPAGSGTDSERNPQHVRAESAARPTGPDPTRPQRESESTRARDGADLETSDPTTREILASLRSHKPLALVADLQSAEMVLGRLLSKPKPLAHVLAQLENLAHDAEAAEVAGTPWSREHMLKMLSRYVDNARPPRPQPGAPPPGVRTVDSLRTTSGVDIMAEMARRASMQAGQVPR